MMPTAPTTEPSPPLLVVDAVERDPAIPTRLVGRLRFGGHRLRVVLDFPRRDFGLIEYVELPWLLGAHLPSQGAVVRLLERIDAGEAICLPRDMSEEVRAADPHCPLQAMDAAKRARLDAAAAEVALEVQTIRRVGTYPVRIAAQMLLAGRALFLEVELYDQTGAIPVMRWITGPDPATLTEAQLYAIQCALTPSTTDTGQPPRRIDAD